MKPRVPTDSFLTQRKRAIQRGWHWLQPVFKNKTFWGGFGLLLGAGFLIYFLMDAWIMPSYTRYGVSVEVPTVENMPYEEARQVLRRAGLRAEREEQQYNPNVPPGFVLDQNPSPKSMVKPGRRIYLKINSEDVPMLRIPDLASLSDRLARSRLRDLGLRVGTVALDTIPSEFPGTVTRQDPASGTEVAKGTTVNLWLSPGPGERLVEIPDVVGLTVAEARQRLLDARLRPLVRPEEAEEAEDVYIERQEPEAGEELAEGSEVRIYAERRDREGA